MVARDPTQVGKFRNYFPELSDSNAEILLLFSYGMTKSEIAEYKGIKIRTIHNCMSNLCKQFEVRSGPDSLRAIVNMRILAAIG